MNLKAFDDASDSGDDDMDDQEEQQRENIGPIEFNEKIAEYLRYDNSCSQFQKNLIERISLHSDSFFSRHPRE